MSGFNDRKSVLIVSSSRSTAQSISSMLSSLAFSRVDAASSAGEARRALVDQAADIVIINCPLSDEFGTELAVEASEKNDCGVLLFVRAELFDGICRKVEQAGVLTVVKPAGRHAVLQALYLLCAAVSKIKAYKQKSETLEAKMREIRLVNRAKLLLVERLKMSEADAHRYIEKAAMDGCIKRKEIAEKIIRTYED